MGVSAKALRLYESHGLLAPMRSQSGWRAYGAKEIATLHQGDIALGVKVKAMWNEAMADPKSAPKLPLNPEIFAFVDKAWRAAQADRTQEEFTTETRKTRRKCCTPNAGVHSPYFPCLRGKTALWQTPCDQALSPFQ